MHVQQERNREILTLLPHDDIGPPPLKKAASECLISASYYVKFPGSNSLSKEINYYFILKPLLVPGSKFNNSAMQAPSGSETRPPKLHIAKIEKEDPIIKVRQFLETRQ